MKSMNVVDARGRTPLRWAILRDDRVAVQESLGFNANSNVTGATGFIPIDTASSAAACKLSLDADASINNGSFTTIAARCTTW